LTLRIQGINSLAEEKDKKKKKKRNTKKDKKEVTLNV